MADDRWDELSKKDSVLAAMAIISAIVVGGFIGNSVYVPPPEYGSYPEPVWDEDMNYSVNYGPHWVHVQVINSASEPLNITLAITGFVVFQSWFGVKDSATLVIYNATGDILTIICHYLSTDSLLTVQFPDPLTDQTELTIRISDSGQVVFFLQQASGVSPV